MLEQNIILWKQLRLNENPREIYCQRCIKFESLNVHQGTIELCAECRAYHRKLLNKERANAIR